MERTHAKNYRETKRAVWLKLKTYIDQAFSLPPHIFIKKAVLKFARPFLFNYHLYRDLKKSTFSEIPFDPSTLFQRYFSPPPIDILRIHHSTICSIVENYIAHRFNLLGSGWKQVKYGMNCDGFKGYRYEMSLPIEPDSNGNWLIGRINEANLEKSIRIWQLVDKNYTPIDWHIDFKSGYRWFENTWYKKIIYGRHPGVDVKVPWELARMQYLPQLSFAFALANEGHQNFHQPSVYLREFRNQILDFIANNPPRFGVNWTCTMDVGIRVANWLVAYDLFKAFGAKFDEGFERVFIRSIYEHGLHIINNLEWSPIFRSNHYLADIVGLLFASAYLPRSSELDAWLAFSVQQLINEVKFQFNPDGSNFEASTSYHRLSAEMIIYATTLIIGLPFQKQAALKNYDHRLIKGHPHLKPPPILFHDLVGSDRPIPFPKWYIERLEKMAEFIMLISKPDGHIPQVGDNDSGRFLKLQPLFHRIIFAKAKKSYINLENYTDLPNQATYWDENHSDHRHLVAGINALFGREDFSSFTGEGWLDAYLIKQLSGGIQIPNSFNKKNILIVKQHHPSTNDLITLCSFPDFGLYVYHSKRFYLAVRCGPIGQNGAGGHSHNDQLSFELSMNGVPFIIDPGTYLYTPLPEIRNLFRSTSMHNTLVPNHLEQNNWLEGSKGLFRMSDSSKASVLEFNLNKFVGQHCGFGPTHRRTFEIYNEELHAVDEIKINGIKKIFFHLPPNVENKMTDNSKIIILIHKNSRISLEAATGYLSVKDSLHSIAYGIVESSKVIELTSTEDRIKWSIKFQN